MRDWLLAALIGAVGWAFGWPWWVVALVAAVVCLVGRRLGWLT